MADDKKAEEKNKKTKRPTAKKRDLQNASRNTHNRSYKAKVSTAVRSLKESIEKKDSPTVQIRLQTVYSLMDKGVKTGIFKLNKASRIKARLTKLSAV
jgi:small subunit ribosomal protein S20